MNALFGWEENFWSNKKPSVVRLEDPDAIRRAIVYTLVNPPASGLVPHATQWPGAHTADMEFGSSLEVERPKVFFRKDGPMPKTVTLKLVAPEAFRSMGDASFTDLVRHDVATRERQIQDDLQKNGRRFLGRERCLRFDRLDRPRTEEPRCTLSPTIASTDENVRKAALQLRKQFLAEYRVA
jgi:putative transposase